MKFERNVESIAFAYETDAIDTLVHLKDIIKAYGRVTVKDLMDLVGVAPNPDDDRLGWLNHGGVCRTERIRAYGQRSLMVNMEPLMATSILPAMTREGETFTEGVLDCLTLMQIIKGGYRHMAACECRTLTV